MAITAYFYQFEKKINSTAQPTIGVGDIGLSVELKNVTNLFTPSLTITDSTFMSGGAITNPMKFTYCYIPDFSRYYFVRSWSWILGRWECSLEVDVLASFKTGIGDTTAFVLRSASDYDADIVDTKYPTKSDCQSSSTTQSSIWHTNLDSGTITDGFYVLGIVNNDSGAMGAVSYYACSCTVLRSFMAQLYASPSWMNITDASISNDLQKMLINPIQYIISCMYFPLSLSIVGAGWTTISTIPIGWWSITLTSPAVFYKLTSTKLQHDSSLDLTIPTHPSATGAYKWLMNSPYSIYQLEFFPFGVFQIDAAKLYGYDTLRCEIKTDLITGCATLYVRRKKSGSNYSGALYTVTTQLGIPISMAQMSVDLSRLGSTSTWALSAGMALASDTAATSDLVNAAVAAVTPDVPTGDNLANILALGQATNYTGVGVFGNWQMSYAAAAQELGANPSPLAAASSVLESAKPSGDGIASLLKSAGKVAANIGNAVLASSGVCQMTGNTGTIAQYYFDQVLTLFYYDITDTDPTHYGYPLMQSKKISNLSGFILCANGGDLTIAATQYERQAVISLMTSGFYYE